MVFRLQMTIIWGLLTYGTGKWVSPYLSCSRTRRSKDWLAHQALVFSWVGTPAPLRKVPCLPAAVLIFLLGFCLFGSLSEVLDSWPLLRCKSHYCSPLSLPHPNLLLHSPVTSNAWAPPRVTVPLTPFTQQENETCLTVISETPSVAPGDQHRLDPKAPSPHDCLLFCLGPQSFSTVLKLAGVLWTPRLSTPCRPCQLCLANSLARAPK